MPEVMCAHANVIAQPVVEALVKQNFAWRASAMSSRRVLRSLHSALTHVSRRVIFVVSFFFCTKDEKYQNCQFCLVRVGAFINDRYT